MTSLPLGSPGLPRLRRESVAQWVPWVRGPTELILRCEGSAAARFVHGLHVRWPFVRGHSRLMGALPKTPEFTSAAFLSPSGVPLSLDMTHSSFLYLSGRLPSEPLEVALLNRLLRPGDVFVDVGAHRGLFIAHLLGRVRPGGRVVAFEPSRSNAQFIRQTFGSPQDLTVHELALSDEAGSGWLARDGEVFAHLSSAASERGTAVRVARLDELLDPPSPPAACFVKIDVEGAEARVIRGAAGPMWQAANLGWMVESLPNEGERRAELLATIRQMSPAATLFGVSNGKGLVAIHAVRDDDPTVNNVLALSPPLVERLRGLGEIVVRS